MYVYVSFCTCIQDTSVTIVSVCAQKYIQNKRAGFLMWAGQWAGGWAGRQKGGGGAADGWGGPAVGRVGGPTDGRVGRRRGGPAG
jgi:hypothetical protein